MHPKWHSAVLIALGLLSIIGCDKRNNNSIAPAQSNAITPKPIVFQFSDQQNDLEGYNQFQWGMKFEDFKKIIIEQKKKTDSDYTERKFNKFFGYTKGGIPQFYEDHNNIGYFTTIATNYILRVPSDSTSNDKYYALQEFMPTSFSIFFDSENSTYYYFNNDLLCFISTNVTTDPSEQLKTKHTFISSLFFGSADANNGKYQIDLYRRNQTNTRIYNVYYQMTPKQGDIITGITSRFIIYIPSSYLNSLSSEIANKVATARQAQNQAAELINQKTNEKIQ